MDFCAVCKSPLKWQQPSTVSSTAVECPRCGRFDLGDRAAALLATAVNKQRAILSYAIRRMQWPVRITPKISFEDVQNIWQSERLPTMPEQADILILLLGQRQPSNVESFTLTKYQLDGEIGSAITEDLGPNGWRYVVDYLKEKKLLTYGTGSTDNDIWLMMTIPGWLRFEELQRTKSDSRKAFMAMKFGDPKLDHMFQEHLVSAVSNTGFQLERLDMNPKPGLIDARMEVEIRASRFMIADLTEGNRGAYWEAGFAAGLGKPVFYTCEKEYFKKEGSHFDTNHHYTVLWQPGTPKLAMEELKAAIRRAFPADAKLHDD